MKNSVRLLRTMTLTLLLTCFVSGCAGTIVLRSDEQITPHPTDEQKVCLDKGYLIKVFEECKP